MWENKEQLWRIVRSWLPSILTHQSCVYLALCWSAVSGFKNYLLFCNILYLLTVPKYGLWLNKHAIRLRKKDVTPLTTPQHFRLGWWQMNTWGLSAPRDENQNPSLQQREIPVSLNRIASVAGYEAKWQGKDSGSQTARGKGLISFALFFRANSEGGWGLTDLPQDSKLQDVSEYPQWFPLRWILLNNRIPWV